jgi:sulfur transfer protein SufE
VHGCESEVWLVHRVEADRHRFAIDTDSRVIQGLSILVLLLIDNRTRRDIEALDLEATFAELGLEKYLSPSRSNGFRALLDQALALVRASSRD